MTRKPILWLMALAGILALTAQVPPFRYSQVPVVTVPNLANVALGLNALTHFWGFSDNPGGATPGPCATQLVDSINNGSAATPVPSPVPLTVATPAAPSQCGAVGIVKDGSMSMEFANGILGNQAQYAETASSGIMSGLCNGNAGGACTNGFSIFCVVVMNNVPSASTNYFFSADGTASGLNLGANFTNGLVFNEAGTGITQIARFSSGEPYLVEFTFNPTGTVSTGYVNGVKALATASPVPQVSANSNTFFGNQTGSANGWNGRLQYCGTENVTDTDAGARALFAATGFF